MLVDPPGSPGDIDVTEVGGDFVSLQWERPHSDGGGRIIGYYIEKKEASAPNWSRVNMVSQNNLTSPLWSLKLTDVFSLIVLSRILCSESQTMNLFLRQQLTRILDLCVK